MWFEIPETTELNEWHEAKSTFMESVGDKGIVSNGHSVFPYIVEWGFRVILLSESNKSLNF